MYSLIVGKMGIESNYFLDEMSEIEMAAIIDAFTDEYKDSWEKTRWLGWVTAATMVGTKSPTDLLKFKWDEEEKEVVVEDLEQTKQALLAILEKIN